MICRAVASCERFNCFWKVVLLGMALHNCFGSSEGTGINRSFSNSEQCKGISTTESKGGKWEQDKNASLLLLFHSIPPLIFQKWLVLNRVQANDAANRNLASKIVHSHPFEPMYWNNSTNQSLCVEAALWSQLHCCCPETSFNLFAETFKHTYAAGHQLHLGTYTQKGGGSDDSISTFPYHILERL